MHQIRFPLGLRPRPPGELTALPQPLAGFKGLLLSEDRGGDGTGKGRKGEGKGGEGDVLQGLRRIDAAA